jgi:hypothetical protein
MKFNRVWKCGYMFGSKGALYNFIVRREKKGEGENNQLTRMPLDQ